MIATAPFTELPPQLASADLALVAVLADTGATLPARDTADARLVASVRTRTGRVIEKESDLAPADRWPDYRSLLPLADSDHDGLPDFWETQFDLDPRDPADSKKISASGYAHIEHYLNNTEPAGAAEHHIGFAGAGAKVARSVRIRRADQKIGQTVAVDVPGGGDRIARRIARIAAMDDKPAAAGRDVGPLPGQLTRPAGHRAVALPLAVLPTASDNRTVVITLTPGAGDHFIGCPSQALVVIRR